MWNYIFEGDFVDVQCSYQQVCWYVGIRGLNLLNIVHINVKKKKKKKIMEVPVV